MRKTLRRSCNACAKSKVRCDLLSPRCSRCRDRGINCVYANEPLSSSVDYSTASEGNSPENIVVVSTPMAARRMLLVEPGTQSFDPFESYPPTRLPRAQVQQLIQHFLSSIAFQYYPLDLNATSNPFVVSWWPLALADPALFHVSLQTASLDVDLRSQKGFATSDILMADSVSLVRSKIEDPATAILDETLDSVVTLAAIEYGKGNVDVSKMHIDGVKSMVRMRGGIETVKLNNPLTARMVAWVALVLSQYPQFETQDDFSQGNGLSPTTLWLEAGVNLSGNELKHCEALSLDPDIQNIMARLAWIFCRSENTPLSTTDLHDLTCFVLHRLLLWSPRTGQQGLSTTLSASECVRNALVLNMLILHGPTYFSHALLQHNVVLKLRAHLENFLLHHQKSHVTLTLWLLSMGLIASIGTHESDWFTMQAGLLANTICLRTWPEILSQLEEVLWLKSLQAERLFQDRWEAVLEQR